MMSDERKDLGNSQEKSFTQKQNFCFYRMMPPNEGPPTVVLTQYSSASLDDQHATEMNH
jgi:hypothetical protein